METAAPIADALNIPLRAEIGLCEWHEPSVFPLGTPDLPALETLTRVYPRLDDSYASFGEPPVVPGAPYLRRCVILAKGGVRKGWGGWKRRTSLLLHLITFG